MQGYGREIGQCRGHIVTFTFGMNTCFLYIRIIVSLQYAEWLRFGTVKHIESNIGIDFCPLGFVRN